MTLIQKITSNVILIIVKISVYMILALLLLRGYILEKRDKNVL
jgi:hypothetical protein